MSIKQNKGEWSELYVLLRLLAEGRLYSAGSDMQIIDDAYFAILEIIRNEGDNKIYKYHSKDENTIELFVNDDKITSISRNRLEEYADRLLGAIKSGGSKGAFAIAGSDEMLSELRTEKVKAPSTDKTDITIQIHDNKTSINTVVGYSIKSDLGMPPTLLNASRSTNFIYEVCGDISDEDIDRINAIETSNKIIDRISEVTKIATLKYVGMSNKTFQGNVILIDSLMDTILAQILLLSYQRGITQSSELITELEKLDPIGYVREGTYRYKYKKFLSAIALGMLPSKVWDGRDEANGGYIIVKENGEIIAYHLYNRDSFETYLLNNTSLERASTGRNDYASLYRADDNKVYINLNLQIRFK